MKKSEPPLAPEWLRSAGNLNGGGSSSAHHFSSSSHSDSSSLSHNSRNRNSKTIGDIGSHRPLLERSSSSNARRNLSNGVEKHAYSNFNRSHRDKDREREKERLSYMVDPWDPDYSDTLNSLGTGRENNKLQRSHSVLPRKQGDIMPRRVSVDPKNGINLSHKSESSIPVGHINGIGMQKTVFEKNFPSLGSEDRQGTPQEVVRVSSPGLSSAVQSLPVGNSPLIGGEGWTSALAEVPNSMGGVNTGSGSPSQSVSSPNASGSASGLTALNMAEALAQAPSRIRTTPQVTVNTQRLEELAIKQSRQLIPVTPSMPKSLALLSSDKSKTKTSMRISEASMAASKTMPQLPTSLHSANQSLPSGQAKSDASKSSGKLFVLKPSWENGISSPIKDIATLTCNVSNGRAANSQESINSRDSSAAARGSNCAKDHRPTLLNKMAGLTLEKKPSSSKARSRNDFFKLIKNKKSGNMSADQSRSDTGITSTEEKPDILKPVEISTASQHTVLANGTEMMSNGDLHEDSGKVSHVEEENMSFEDAIDPDEEEAAFLRSLGWENSAEVERLTEEEINSFVLERKKAFPGM